MVPISNQMGGTFDELTKNNIENTNLMVKNNNHSASQAKALMIIVIAIGVLFSILITLVLTRAVVGFICKKSSNICSGNCNGRFNGYARY